MVQFIACKPRFEIHCPVNQTMSGISSAFFSTSDTGSCFEFAVFTLLADKLNLKLLLRSAVFPEFLFSLCQLMMCYL